MTIHQCGLYKVKMPSVNGTGCYNQSSVVEGLNSSTFHVIMELYLITPICLIGICGNFVSLVVLKKDEIRHHGLFLLQALAACDAFYLVVALMRYPTKHLIPDEVIYLNIQLYIFPLLKIAQTMCIWIMVLVTVDR